MRTSAIFVEFTTPWSLLATHHVIRGQFSAYELPFSKTSNRSVDDDRFWHVFALPNLFNEIGQGPAALAPGVDIAAWVAPTLSPFIR